MTEDEPEYFLFIGSADSESATTRLRASGARYHKKMLSSGPENWSKIVTLVSSPDCRGVLVVLRGNDYKAMIRPEYEESAWALFDALVNRPHIILVHEAIFLTEEQRTAADIPASKYENTVDPIPVSEDDEEYELYRLIRDERAWEISDDVREPVNKMLRERQLNVYPYRTNVERSIISSGFLDDNERHLLFRIYVPIGRLYAQEAEGLLSLFREWLGEKGHSGVRQEGYSTSAGQVFEFFSADGEPEGGVNRYFEDFSSFLEDCVTTPEAAVAQLVATGTAPGAAEILVSRFAIRARRLSLDLKQRREERMLSLKHEFENLFIETNGFKGEDFVTVLEQWIPLPAPTGIIQGHRPTLGSTVTVNNFNPQFIEAVAGSVVQNLSGTVNLNAEAKDLLGLIATFGGYERAELETAVHELEDDGARDTDRVAARGRLKRFLADLGNRGLGAGIDILQRYLEHKIGVS